ncbi:hypothetical protein N9022_00055 [bacterium]|nr:hypothetical protein [Akkermansiaceae bacterium]MDB4551526.1 hypothetical protein [bacterium]
MPKFKLNYATREGEVSEKTVISSKDYLTAVAEFAEAHPSDIQFIDVYSFLGGDQRVTNPNWEDKKVSLEREQAEAERLAEVELLKKIIIAADTPLQLSFTQLELLIENFLLFPTLKESGGEIYPLREKLYMLSFWNTALQSSLQTRLLSQIASGTNTPQKGNTKANWAPLAAAAALGKLDNIDDSIEGLE